MRDFPRSSVARVWVPVLAAAAGMASLDRGTDPGDLVYFVHRGEQLVSGGWASTFADPMLQSGLLQLVLFGAFRTLDALGSCRQDVEDRARVARHGGHAARAGAGYRDTLRLAIATAARAARRRRRRRGGDDDEAQPARRLARATDRRCPARAARSRLVRVVLARGRGARARGRRARAQGAAVSISSSSSGSSRRDAAPGSCSASRSLLIPTITPETPLRWSSHASATCADVVL